MRVQFAALRLLLELHHLALELGALAREARLLLLVALDLLRVGLGLGLGLGLRVRVRARVRVEGSG